MKVPTLQRRGWLAWGLVLTLALSAYTRSLGNYQAQFYVFGTLVDITIAGVPHDQAAAAVADIARDFQTMHGEWHAWQAGGLLAQLNQAIAEGKSLPVNARTRELIQISQRMSAHSDGLFNPAISRLIALWGFHGADPATWQPPAPAAIASLLAARPSMADLQIQGDSVSCANPAVRLDFGAVAKGYAVDLALTRLQTLGIRNAMVNAGGNLRAMGQNGGRPWRVGIRHPNGKDVLASVELQEGEAVMTSGGYERYHEYQGKRYAHIIDPRNGYPVAETASVTVIHPNGAEADAASTALAVAGKTDWQRIAQHMGMTQVLLMDASGTVHMTPAMAARVRFTQTPPPPVQISGK